MNPYQAAIMRILIGHYGGNIQNPHFGALLQRLAANPAGQTIPNQSFIGQLGAGVFPRGYQPYGGHYIPSGAGAVVNQLSR